jgi:hypothetical protein
LGNRGHWRLRKFYESQVEQILGLLDKQFKEGQLPLDTYLDICEQKGIEPDPNEMPPTMGDFPLEVQVAFLLHDLLPDRWDGMSGSYMGKDFSSLGTLLDVWDVKDKKSTIYFIKHIEARNTDKINKKLERQRKSQETKAKGGINSANLRK